jgi:hypothetical protein
MVGSWKWLVIVFDPRPGERPDDDDRGVGSAGGLRRADWQRAPIAAASAPILCGIPDQSGGMACVSRLCAGQGRADRAPALMGEHQPFDELRDLGSSELWAPRQKVLSGAAPRPFDAESNAP